MASNFPIGHAAQAESIEAIQTNIAPRQDQNRNSDGSRLFERFDRLSSHDRWQHSSTGLGLALVKALTEQHLDETAQSGHGQTCFTVTIPIDRRMTVPILQLSAKVEPWMMVSNRLNCV